MTLSPPERQPFSLWPKRRTPPGSPPGTLIPDPTAVPPSVRVIAYGPEGFFEQETQDLEQIAACLRQYAVTWVDVEGLGDLTLIQRLGDLFALHPLALEDVINLHQRAKVEDYGVYLFIVTRMVSLVPQLEMEQLSLFLGKNFVLTFQYLPGDSLEPVRLRLRQGAGVLRGSGPDYLAYALLDAVQDNYFPVLEAYGEQLEGLEDAAIAEASPIVRRNIHEVRHELRTLRRAVWPQRDALNQLLRDPTPLIAPETRLYLRDTYDHIVQLIDLVETYRELGSDLMDLYLSGVSNRMNEIMKVLTIISTIFIPLSFIAGVYGMNFVPAASPLNMPELNWHWGYPFALGLMAAVAAALLYFIRRRGWW